MLSAINNTILFLVQVIFNIYMITLLVRILLESARVNYYNPVIQFLLTITNPTVKPVGKFISYYKNINSAAIIVLFITGIVKLSIIVWLKANVLANPIGLAVWTSGELINLLINIYFYAILFGAILSWIAPHTQNPAVDIIARLTDPVLQPFRKIIPPIANIDISPLVAMVCLQACAILFVQFIMSYGALLSFGKALV